MAKKKLLPPAPKTQASRKRKQTPPKKKGQLVKAKPRGRMGRPPLTETDPFPFAGTGSGTQGLFEYLLSRSPESMGDFSLSCRGKISKAQRRLREDLGEVINIEVEYRLAGLVMHLKTLWKRQQKSGVSSPILLQEAPESTEMGPWFHSRTESNALRKEQTIDEQKISAIAFQEFGCLNCHRKDCVHGGLMLCEKCRVTIYARRRRIMDRQARLRKRGIDAR